MSSTEFNIGLAHEKSSSRVIKPPGGGSTNIFAPAEEAKPHARPKYDQQNSSNLNFCMNTVDPNIKVQEQFAPSAPESAAPAPVVEAPAAAAAPAAAPAEAKTNGNVQARPEINLPANHHHRSTALW